MKTIEYFLASSTTELHDQRMELGNYFRQLDKRFIKNGIRINLTICEDFDDEVEQHRTQDTYNEFIRNCDYFLILIWHWAGEYTQEEFRVAMTQFRQTNKPIVSPYFCTMEKPDPSDPTKKVPFEKSVEEFKTLLNDEYGDIYTTYTHLDSIKLRILLKLTSRPDLFANVEFKDGKVRLDGEELENLNLENVPLYGSHEAIGKLRKEYAELEAECLDAAQALHAAPDSAELRKKYADLNYRRSQVAEQLHAHEAELLSVTTRIVEMTSDGEPLTERARRAVALLNEGRAKEAETLLNAEDRRKEEERLERIEETLRASHRAALKENLLEIEAVRAQGLNVERTQKIIALYEEAKERIEKYGLDREPVIDYVSFLKDLKKYDDGIKVGKKLCHFYQSLDQADERTLGRLYNPMGILYSYRSDKRGDSERMYNEALAIRRRLAEAQPAVYEPDAAATCNNLANLYRTDTKRREEAEKLYNEALAIYRRLAEAQPAVYEPDVATTCNNLANLVSDDTNRREEAEKLFLEALDIYRRLAEAQPAVYEPVLAGICNNLAILYKNTNRREKAEKLYGKALDIYRRLARTQPAVYEPVLAATCDNLAVLYDDTSRREEAEKLFLEALDIRRSLARTQPAVYEPDVATTCNNLANLYRTDTKRRKEAEKLYIEALAIYRKLAEAQPAVYEPVLAMTCNNLAVLYDDTSRREVAEKLYIEALAICRRLAEAQHAVYEPVLALTLYNMGLLYEECGNNRKMKQFFREAKALAEKYPDDFYCAQILTNLKKL